MIRELLDRLPHDTLLIGGQPYMRRWYIGGFAPAVDCARCRGAGEIDTRTLTDPPLTVAPGLDVYISCSYCGGTGMVPRPGWWWNWKFGAVRLHEIVASDDNRAFHDHPWSFVSIGLRGSYVEETPFINGAGTVPLPGGTANWYRRFRAPFVIRHRPADLHVLAVDGRPVWTLFISGPKRGSWGFHGPFGYIPWRDFEARAQVLYDEDRPDRSAICRCGGDITEQGPGTDRWAHDSVMHDNFGSPTCDDGGPASPVGAS